MFCFNCRKKIREGSMFCDGCGTKVQSNVTYETSKTEKNVKTEKTYKCSFCGEFLADDALKCPSCGNDTHKRKNKSSTHNLHEKISSVTNNVDSGVATYPYEEIEKSRMFALRQGEKLILKDDGFIYNESEEYEHILVLTNQALVIIEDDEEKKAVEVIRIPLSQINQCIYHRGGVW